ncbi:cytochrome P450 [Lentzea sp. BCCO 10_0856]|uniref:Cytochrome P450 n=1 Tax=Lentzea miocenica TaxID=3095431 RepID=A0ABU4STL1_9PSEU|nr:cytochrome P450 [Lentzea sp. BCCO 10_0856]MDX8029154.1 cytochrome P450 [Lentzea sp. BCCO 10_0856]
MSATIDALDELAKPEHRQDPYPFLHWLREHDPVHRTRCGFYLLSNYDDVAFALQQNTAFTVPDESAMWREIGHGKRSHPAVKKLVAAFTAKNHPCYARLRSAIAGDMTPARVLRLRPRILEHLGNIFDDIGPRLVAGETVDLHAEVSVPLTQYVFADRIGLPEEDRSWIADTIALMTRALGTDDEEVVLEADRASNSVEDYFRARVAERRASPRDDLISRLVAAHDGEDLLIAILWIMWMTGYESTISGIDRAVQAFLTHPEHRSWCDDERVHRFIDETLRHDGVVLYTPIPRIAQDSVTLGGVTIPAGASVRMVIAGANRDPRVFRDPDKFDPARDPRRMLSTGNCCGTTLGRAEMAHVVTGLWQRFPTLVPAGEPVWSPASVARRTVERLPAKLA